MTQPCMHVRCGHKGAHRIPTSFKMTSAQGDAHTNDVDVVCQSEPSTYSLDPVDYLPNEILCKIIGFLSVEDLCHLAVCSKAWRNVTNTNSLWLHLCKLRDWERFGTEVDLRKEKPIHSTETRKWGSIPTFQAESVITGDCNVKDLAPTCEWKEVYMRAWHLDRNWSEGRYREHRAFLPKLTYDKARGMASDGKTYAAGDYYGFVRLWDLNSGRFLRKFQANNLTDSQIRDLKRVAKETNRVNHVINHVHLKKDIGVALYNGGILVFEGSTGNALRRISTSKGSNFDRYEPWKSYFEENKIIVSYRWNDFFPLHIWDISDLVEGVDNGACTETILHIETSEDNPHPEASYHLLGCHGHFVITSSLSHPEFLLWDTRTPKIIRIYKGHKGNVSCGHLDENTIMTGDNAGEVKVWTTASDVCMKTLSEFPDHFYRRRFNTVQFTDKVIVAGTQSRIVVWSRDGILLNMEDVEFENARICSRLVTYTRSPELISVWDLSTGKRLYHNAFEFGPLDLLYTDDTKIVIYICSMVQILHFW
ncbi:probable E3 ubiquitin ligase complex SCF subunit sconB isoform X2 [Patiria miniata]|uniref:F-box domain-containing protein n=1 Tax=Patiria miniata TaxID=46514 RepID=A0A914BTN4_PATMI|nr:probable E3 ubiquitin ligase complex SCF subunit sconB isoform X2 [Patiria miniata]